MIAIFLKVCVHFPITANLGLLIVVLGSQFFSGFWIGWMIEHPTKSNSENPKKLDVQSTFNV
jgi:hypothetical protein